MEVSCPKCGSTQISANKQGFSGSKAAAGAVLTGGVGLLAGTIGSNKVVITCLSCGNTFKPGAPTKEQMEVQGAKNKKVNTVVFKIFAPLFLLLGVIMLFTDMIVFGIILVLLGVFFGFGAYSKPKNIQ